MTSQQAAVVQHEFEIPIDAPPTVVWRSLTEEIDRWWLDDFRVVEGSRRVTLDARLSGAWIEEGENGSGVEWGRVIAISPGRSITFGMGLAPPWGAATSMLHIALEPDGHGATRLKATEAIIGRIDDEGAATIAGGWRSLFGDGLKAHAEAAAR